MLANFALTSTFTATFMRRASTFLVLALLTPIMQMLATFLAKWSLFVRMVWTFFMQSVSTCAVLTLVTSSC